MFKTGKDIWSCDVCHDSFCMDCLPWDTTCSGCNATTCGDSDSCLFECDDCMDSYCDSCLDEDELCPNCSKETEKDEGCAE